MSGKITNPEIVGFLKELAESAGGALSPAAVVEAARPNNSPIHDQFVWDDTEAAKRYRLQQASELLRVTVELIEVKSETYEVRAFTSLSPDRAKDGQSYRGDRCSLDQSANAGANARGCYGGTGCLPEEVRNADRTIRSVRGDPKGSKEVAGGGCGRQGEEGSGAEWKGKAGREWNAPDWDGMDRTGKAGKERSG